jgi:hypothetical protein
MKPLDRRCPCSWRLSQSRYKKFLLGEVAEDWLDRVELIDAMMAWDDLIKDRDHDR